jgi:DNA-binding response OmpR family regulator
MNILLTEDDKHFGSALATCFEQDGHSIDWVQSVAESLSALKTKKYDCVLLDLGLPDMSGERLLEAVRTQDDITPFIVITARGLIHDRISLLDLGADDYMVKPVDIYELLARVRAAVRRANPDEERGATINCGPLTLTPNNLTATWHGESIPLSTKEFWVLEVFMRMKGEVLSLRQLEEILYGFGDEVGSNAVQVHIHHIRKKFSPDLIRTVHGLGYQFIPPTHAA